MLLHILLTGEQQQCSQTLTLLLQLTIPLTLLIGTLKIALSIFYLTL